jgi:hypothetical protein
MKHPVLVKKDYTIYFEYVLYNEIQEIIVVHCDITKWNKTVKKQKLPGEQTARKHEPKIPSNQNPKPRT